MSRVTAVTRAQGSTVRLEASAPRKRGALEERATYVDPRKQKLHRARGGAARRGGLYEGALQGAPSISEGTPAVGTVVSMAQDLPSLSVVAVPNGAHEQGQHE